MLHTDGPGVTDKMQGIVWRITDGCPIGTFGDGTGGGDTGRRQIGEGCRGKPGAGTVKTKHCCQKQAGPQIS